MKRRKRQLKYSSWADGEFQTLKMKMYMVLMTGAAFAMIATLGTVDAKHILPIIYACWVIAAIVTILGLVVLSIGESQTIKCNQKDFVLGESLEKNLAQITTCEEGIIEKDLAKESGWNLVDINLAFDQRSLGEYAGTFEGYFAGLFVGRIWGTMQGETQADSFFKLTGEGAAIILEKDGQVIRLVSPSLNTIATWFRDAILYLRQKVPQNCWTDSAIVKIADLSSILTQHCNPSRFHDKIKAIADKPKDQRPKIEFKGVPLGEGVILGITGNIEGDQEYVLFPNLLWNQIVAFVLKKAQQVKGIFPPKFEITALPVIIKYFLPKET